MSFKELLETVTELPLDLKIELIEKIGETLGFPLDKEVEKAWDREIDKRTAELDSGKVQSISYEDIKSMVLERLK